jgi:flagellin
MVTSVNTNVNAMAAIQSLDMISSQMTSTQSAIETGLKVNQASDSPAVFTIAQGMRANSDALMAVGDSLTAGIAQVQSAANAATSISNQLSTLLQTVTQGESLTDPNSIAAVNAQIKNALSNIDAYAKDSTLNGVNLLNGSGQLNVVNDVAGDTTSVTSTDSTSGGLGLTGLQLNTGGTELSTTNGNTITTGDVVKVTLANNNTIDFEFNDGTATLASQPSATNTVVAVNMDDTTDTNSSLVGKLLTAMQANGVDASENSAGAITVGGGATASVVAGGSGALAATPVTGTGASAIAAVNSAITQIGTTLSTLGAAAIQLQGLSDFTTQLSDSVTTSLGSLVDANLSAESAQLSSLQTKQSLAIQSLTLANQAPSALLSLFR